MNASWDITVTGTGEQVRVKLRLPADQDLSLSDLRAIVATLADVLRAAEGTGEDGDLGEIVR